jgi:hypothetical protein
LERGEATPHFPLSGLILLALATIEEPGTNEELGFLIDEQNPDGWWSVFPVEAKSQYASAYATAWVLLGLNGQLERGFVDKKDVARVHNAIGKGAAWLIDHREPGARWKDYPLVREGNLSESISGVVLHTLHQLAPQQLRQVDMDWLEQLPKSFHLSSPSYR